MSQTSKKYNRRYPLFAWLSFVAAVGLALYYAMSSFLDNGIKMQSKVVLGGTIVLAIMLLILNTITKYSLRSPAYIVILGLYLCLQSVFWLILAIACGVILDEFVFTPCKRLFRQRYVINHEIDKRIPDGIIASDKP